jgi:hypothetical protein
MKILRIALITLALLCAYASLPAQTVTVSATALQDSAGNLVSGTITFQPSLLNDHPASYRAPGGGQVILQPVSATVTLGAFSIELPDTTLTNPANICFTASLSTAKGSGLGPGYSCVQPHYAATGSTDWCQAGVCDFDDYTPSLPTTALAQTYGSPDLLSYWNVQVAASIAAGNTVTVVSLTDANTVTWNVTNATMNAATLALYSTASGTSDGITARTINMTGLVSGARFTILINPLNNASIVQAQTVTFGSGCTWRIAPGPGLSGNTLYIPPWATWSYIASFVYDGANCIGIVGD